MANGFFSKLTSQQVVLALVAAALGVLVGWYFFACESGSLCGDLPAQVLVSGSPMEGFDGVYTLITANSPHAYENKTLGRHVYERYSSSPNRWTIGNRAIKEHIFESFTDADVPEDVPVTPLDRSWYNNLVLTTVKVTCVV